MIPENPRRIMAVRSARTKRTSRKAIQKRRWRAKARRNSAAQRAISERLSHRERQEKDIFDVTGQGCNALNYYEKWHEVPAHRADFARAANGAGPAEIPAINSKFA